MEKVMELNKKATTSFKDRDKKQVEKFMVSLSLADPDSLKVLEDYKIALTKSSQFIVLTQDPKTLTQALELATKMSFIDAYRENPKRLCQLVTNVIKRMAKCDAIGVTYKDENGKFENFIFSEREFNQKIGSLTEAEQEVIAPPVADEKKDNNLAQIKEYALRVLEQFAMEDKKDEIYARLDEISGSELGTKEMLIEAFKVCAGNTELLSDAIDDLLAQEETNELGRAA